MQDQTTDVEASLVLAEQRFANAQQTIVELEARLSEKEEAIASVELERDQFKVRARSKEQVQIGLKKKLCKAEEKHDRLVLKNVELKNHAQEVAAAATQARTAFATAMKENVTKSEDDGKALFDKLAKAETLAGARLAELNEMKSQLESKLCKETQLTTSVNHLRSENSSLSTLATARLGELGELRSQLTSKSTAFALMEKSLRALREERESLMQALDQSRQLSDGNSAEAEEARNVAEERRVQLAARVREANELAAEMRKLNADLAEAKRSEVAGEKTMKTQTRQLAAAKSELSRRTAQASAMQGRLNQMDTQICALRSDSSRKEEQILCLQSKLSASGAAMSVSRNALRC